MVVGGVVVETAVEKVVQGVRDEGGGVRKRPVKGGALVGVGKGGWGLV